MPESIWLEMENARAQSGKLEIQIKGDRTEKEQPWWPVALAKAVPGEKNVFAALNKLFEALEKKRIVLAELTAQGNGLICTGIRIQYTESERR